jgi:hypothetical protein
VIAPARKPNQRFKGVSAIEVPIVLVYPNEKVKYEVILATDTPVSPGFGCELIGQFR